MNPRTAVESAALRGAMGLRGRAQRLVAGRPVTIDGQTLAGDLQVMLRLQSIARKRDDEVPFATMRSNMRSETVIVGGQQPIGSTVELQVAGRPARHYLPSRPAVPAGEPGPLLVFIHGGGFVEGDIDTHDAPCRVLAEKSGVPVLSVTYRLAPEATLPAAHDDVVAAYRWVLDHADELGADPARLAVGGDSAGGNLAAWVAIEAARAGLPLAFQLLVYPCTEGGRDTESLRLFGEGFYLTKTFMDRVDRTYLNDPSELADERISPLHAVLPDGLAPAYLCTAGFDPLRDEGEAYARKLADAGVKVEMRRFCDQIHGFLNIVGVGSSSRAAVEEIAGVLRHALV